MEKIPTIQELEEATRKENNGLLNLRLSRPIEDLTEGELVSIKDHLIDRHSTMLTGLAEGETFGTTLEYIEDDLKTTLEHLKKRQQLVSNGQPPAPAPRTAGRTKLTPEERAALKAKRKAAAQAKAVPPKDSLDALAATTSPATPTDQTAAQEEIAKASARAARAENLKTKKSRYRTGTKAGEVQNPEAHPPKAGRTRTQRQTHKLTDDRYKTKAELEAAGRHKATAAKKLAEAREAAEHPPALPPAVQDDVRVVGPAPSGGKPPPTKPPIAAAAAAGAEEEGSLLGKRFAEFMAKHEDKLLLGAGLGLAAAGIGFMVHSGLKEKRRREKGLTEQEQIAEESEAGSVNKAALIAGGAIGGLTYFHRAAATFKAHHNAAGIGAAVALTGIEIADKMVLGVHAAHIIYGRNMEERVGGAGELIGEAITGPLVDRMLKMFTKAPKGNMGMEIGRAALRLLVGGGMAGIGHTIGATMDKHARRPFVGPMIKHTQTPTEPEVMQNDSRHQPGGLHVHITSDDAPISRKAMDRKMTHLHNQGYAY